MATSVGRGTGLNFRMPNFVPVWQREFAQEDRRKAQNAALKAKAQESQDKALNKILDSDFKVDPNKFHPKFLPFVLEANRNAISKIREARNSGDPTWQNRVPEIVDKAVKETSLQLHNSQMAFAHEKAQEGKVYKSGQLSKSLNSNFGDLSDIPSDVSMGVSFNPETRSLVYQPQGVIDTRRLRQLEVFNDPKNYTLQEEVDSWTDAGQPTRKIINTIPDTGLANFNATLLRNPDYAFNISHEYAKEKGIKLSDDFKTNEDFGKDLAKWHFVKLQEERGKIIKDQIGSRPPQASAEERKSKPRISGNSVTIGNSKWSYFADGKEEIFTPSRTDVTENKVFDFEKIVSGGKIEIVSGRLKEIVIGTDNKPKINIVVEGVEESVPYTPNNIGKIKNEFNANPYEIRALFNGDSSKVPSGGKVGTTAKGTGSNVSGQKKSEGKIYKISGKDYSEDAVKRAADASGMSIEEYLTEVQ